MMNIGWFTTARGPGSLNLFTTMLNNIKSGKIKARLSFVFINRDVKGNEYRMRLIRMAEENDIPVILYPSDTFKPELKQRDLEAWRDEYGKGVRERISKHPLDLGVLAGYMLIIDPQTCRDHTIINLHPALPDTYKGTWEEIVGKVIENNDPTYGATIHICSPELDRGDVISYDSFDVDRLRTADRTAEDMAKRVRAEELKREAPLLIETIKLIVDGEVELKNGKVYDKKGVQVTSYPCLADLVSEDLEQS